DYALLLSHFLKRATKLYGERTAGIGDEKYLTYREFQARVNQLYRGLQALGIKKVDRIAYFVKNTAEMMDCLYDVLQLGAIFVPLNTRLKAKKYEYILNHSGSTVLYMDVYFQEIILPVRDKLKTVKTIICNQPLQEDDTVVYEDMLANQST